MPDRLSEVEADTVKCISLTDHSRRLESEISMAPLTREPMVASQKLLVRDITQGNLGEVVGASLAQAREGSNTKSRI